MTPGEMLIKDGEIELNAGRKTVILTVGIRLPGVTAVPPVQVIVISPVCSV